MKAVEEQLAIGEQFRPIKLHSEVETSEFPLWACRAQDMKVKVTVLEFHPFVGK